MARRRMAYDGLTLWQALTDVSVTAVALAIGSGAALRSIVTQGE